MQLNTKSNLTICSFFSGGGLFDLGFKSEFNIIWANEFNPNAANSYKANIGNHIVVGDIREISKDIKNIPYADLYIGGPPCIDYSSIGANRGDSGKTGGLVWKYQEIIKKNKPKAFVMENVVGLIQRHKETFHKLIKSYSAIGYNVTYKILKASQFGTPQDRKRVFVVGIRNDLDYAFEFPTGQNKVKTVREAFIGLSKPQTVQIKDKILGEIPNHTVTWTSPTPERILELKMNPHPNQRVGLRRLVWDKPSYTLTSHIAKDGREFLHPEEDRKITIRESLRLMGIPDTYIIPETVPLSQQYTIVGNGVAYPIAKALSKKLREVLESETLKDKSREIQFVGQAGEQLSFDNLLSV